jgi:hypothetical protein
LPVERLTDLLQDESFESNLAKFDEEEERKAREGSADPAIKVDGGPLP